MIFAFGPQTSLSKKTRWKAKRKPEDDPQVELDVSKIQRSQEPCVNDDSESEKSDEEEDEEMFVNAPPVRRREGKARRRREKRETGN